MLTSNVEAEFRGTYVRVKTNTVNGVIIGTEAIEGTRKSIRYPDFRKIDLCYYCYDACNN